MAAPLIEAAKAHLAARDALEAASNESLSSLGESDPRFAAVNTTLDELREAVAQAEAV
jgi:hypothetical protein